MKRALSVAAVTALEASSCTACQLAVALCIWRPICSMFLSCCSPVCTRASSSIREATRYSRTKGHTPSTAPRKKLTARTHPSHGANPITPPNGQCCPWA